MMKSFSYSKLLLLSSLSVSGQAQSPAEIKLALTQLTGQQCENVTLSDRKTLPGDCITYRIQMENIGERDALNVVVFGLIPKHTILRSNFRNVANQQKLSTVIELKPDGTRVIKTTVDTLPSNGNNTITIEYSVMIL